MSAGSPETPAGLPGPWFRKGALIWVTLDISTDVVNIPQDVQSVNTSRFITVPKWRKCSALRRKTGRATKLPSQRNVLLAQYHQKLKLGPSKLPSVAPVDFLRMVKRVVYTSAYEELTALWDSGLG